MGIMYSTLGAQRFTENLGAMGLREGEQRLHTAEGTISPLTTLDVFPPFSDAARRPVEHDCTQVAQLLHEELTRLVRGAGLDSEDLTPVQTPRIGIADVTVLPTRDPGATDATLLTSLGTLTTRLKYVPVADQGRETYLLWLMLQARPEIIHHLGSLEGRESLPALAAREIGMALVPPTVLTTAGPDALVLPGSRVIPLPRLEHSKPPELHAARRLVATMVGLNLIERKALKIWYTFQAFAETGTRDFLATTLAASDHSQPASVLKQRIDAAYWIALARHFNSEQGQDTRESEELLERDGKGKIEPMLATFRAIIESIRVERVKA